MGVGLYIREVRLPRRRLFSPTNRTSDLKRIGMRDGICRAPSASHDAATRKRQVMT